MMEMEMEMEAEAESVFIDGAMEVAIGGIRGFGDFRVLGNERLRFVVL